LLSLIALVLINSRVGYFHHFGFIIVRMGGLTVWTPKTPLNSALLSAVSHNTKLHQPAQTAQCPLTGPF